MAYRGRDSGPRGGAEHLARIHGTEEDKVRASLAAGGLLRGGNYQLLCVFAACVCCCGWQVNCPFYFKIGACRHGDRCSRQHHRPPFSQTVLIPHMWQVRGCRVCGFGATWLLTVLRVRLRLRNCGAGFRTPTPPALPSAGIPRSWTSARFRRR